MDLKKIKNFSIFMIFVFCFINHFLYDFFPCFLTSVFFPVNESICEHMKMLVSSVIMWEFILFVVFKKNNYHFNNFLLNVLCTCICSVFIFLSIYFPFYYLFGDVFVLNVIFLFISIFLSVNIGFSILNKRDYNLELFSFILMIFIYVIFIIFTYYPPRSFLFVDPRNGGYGIIPD